MADTQSKTTTTTVTIETEIVSVTISGDGTADTLSNRTITDTATGEVIVRDVVRTTDDVLVVQPLIDSAIRTAKDVSNGE